ncbi:Glycosyl transferase, family 14, partial [Cynara cardunculus var. scolymus]
PPPPPESLSHGETLSLSPSSQPPSSPPQDTRSSQPISSPPIESAMDVSVKEQIPMMHNGSDEDLVSRVMTISITNTTNATNAPYKVAFMFLTPGPMPLLPLWELFFKGHKGLFSIYIHPHPDYNDTIPQDSVFYGTRITSQPLYWGDISMVDAERRLLANALLDPLNQRFVLLSESCIPLFHFTTTYNYLINSNLSYISSFDDKRKSGRGRYNPQMSPNITIQDWRKGSQWFEINRDLAVRIVVEQKYYSIFKEFCRPPCYNDEHYLPTMVNILYGEMNSNRTVTHVDWSIVGPHPRKFGPVEITEELLNSIRFGSTECVYNNSTTPMCMLFARKFTPATLKPLLTFASLLFGF